MNFLIDEQDSFITLLQDRNQKSKLHFKFAKPQMILRIPSKTNAAKKMPILSFTLQTFIRYGKKFNFQDTMNSILFSLHKLIDWHTFTFFFFMNSSYKPSLFSQELYTIRIRKCYVTLSHSGFFGRTRQAVGSGKRKGKKNSLTPWLLPKMLLYKEEKFCSTYSVIIKFLSQIKPFLYAYEGKTCYKARFVFIHSL